MYIYRFSYKIFWYILRFLLERGSYKVWEVNMEVCPRLEFDNIMFIDCLGYDLYTYGAFDFLCNSIANLWRNIWYHYHTYNHF